MYLTCFVCVKLKNPKLLKIYSCYRITNLNLKMSNNYDPFLIKSILEAKEEIKVLTNNIKVFI